MNYTEDNQVLVSVFCETYNHELYIRQCLDGMLMQKTDFAFEVLIHDDASTDHTQLIIKEYVEKYPDVIKPILQQENQYSKGVNIWQVFQIPRARGKYVALCEGDDYWTDPLKLQKQVDILEADETLMAVVTNSKVVDKEGNELKAKQDDVVPDNKQGRFDLRSFMYKVHHYPTATVCYRRTHVDEIERMTRHMANPYLGDWTLWIALHIFGDFYYLDQVTSAYRINPTSVTHSNVNERRLGLAKANFKIIKSIQDVLPPEYDDIRKELDNTAWMWYQLANAYKHSNKYFCMFYALIRCFSKDHKFLLGKVLRKK